METEGSSIIGTGTLNDESAEVENTDEYFSKFKIPEQDNSEQTIENGCQNDTKTNGRTLINWVEKKSKESVLAGDIQEAVTKERKKNIKIMAGVAIAALIVGAIVGIIYCGNGASINNNKNTIEIASTELPQLSGYIETIADGTITYNVNNSDIISVTASTIDMDDDIELSDFFSIVQNTVDDNSNVSSLLTSDRTHEIDDMYITKLTIDDISYILAAKEDENTLYEITINDSDYIYESDEATVLTYFIENLVQSDNEDIVSFSDQLITENSADIDLFTIDDDSK